MQNQPSLEIVKITSLASGIKYQDRKDLVIVELPKTATSAGVFTKNAFAAAPVLLTKQNLAKNSPLAFVINSGNANAATGTQGLQDAQTSCELVAQLLHIDASEVLPFSTGVIGENLPMAKIKASLTAQDLQLGTSNYEEFAQAIMTTDTFAKIVRSSILINDAQVNFVGIAKGAGMICPNMATTLSYVFTDAKIAREHLTDYLNQAIEPSFNSISIDSDTSTNDSSMLVALGNGVAIGANNSEFLAQLTQVYMQLAMMLVKDGEGATKLIHIHIKDAKDLSEAKNVGYSIANSPLVKTAFFASDPNWGRLVMAIGKTQGLEDLDTSKVNLYLEDLALLQNGVKAPTYNEAAAAKIMQNSEINIHLELARGTANAQIHTCDLSYDYVKINAEYRS